MLGVLRQAPNCPSVPSWPSESPNVQPTFDPRGIDDSALPTKNLHPRRQHPDPSTATCRVLPGAVEATPAITCPHDVQAEVCLSTTPSQVLSAHSENVVSDVKARPLAFTEIFRKLLPPNSNHEFSPNSPTKMVDSSLLLPIPSEELTVCPSSENP